MTALEKARAALEEARQLTRGTSSEHLDLEDQRRYLDLLTIAGTQAAIARAEFGERQGRGHGEARRFPRRTVRVSVADVKDALVVALERRVIGEDPVHDPDRYKAALANARFWVDGLLELFPNLAEDAVLAVAKRGRLQHMQVRPDGAALVSFHVDPPDEDG